MRRLMITTVTPAMAVVNGYGSRNLIQEYRNGRAPMWSSNPRGWVIQPANIADLVALAELRGFYVVLDEGEVVR